MADVPETRYARSGGVSIAYQVFGGGTVDIVAIPPMAQNIEVAWEHPSYRRMYAGLGSFARNLHFDKRGTGMSDRGAALPSLDERVDDVRAVMDAAGIDRAYLFGVSEGTPLAIVFAATHPHRTLGLALFGGAASALPRPPDHPWGPFPALDPEWPRRWLRAWGTEGTLTLEAFAPSVAGDQAYRRWQAHYERQSASPGAIRQLMATNAQVDVRDVLPAVRVPTLVMRRRGDRVFPPEVTRYLAERIPGSRLVELDGDDHFLQVGDQEAWMAELSAFTTGSRAVGEPDRMLATLVFTDLVGSTEELVRRGDRRWRELLDDHDALAAARIAEHGGVLVQTTGDGVLARFDGAGKAIRFALALRSELSTRGLRCRAGLHAGEVERRGTNIGGIAVHVAARVAAAAPGDDVLVSRTVKDLVAGSALRFEPRGRHRLKGLDEEWELFAVAGTTGAGS